MSILSSINELCNISTPHQFDNLRPLILLSPNRFTRREWEKKEINEPSHWLLYFHSLKLVSGRLSMSGSFNCFWKFSFLFLPSISLRLTWHSFRLNWERCPLNASRKRFSSIISHLKLLLFSFHGILLAFLSTRPSHRTAWNTRTEIGWWCNFIFNENRDFNCRDEFLSEFVFWRRSDDNSN